MVDPGGPWWRSAVGYEVYLRSFADGNADGVGDLVGLADRLDHLAWLGVDMVWITPFYPSPMADYGYDVADYTDVDPLFGTLADFDRVVDRAHELGLRVLVDLVPNHTSDRHTWFQQARRSRDDPHRDFYIWRDPAPDGGPPNNWISYFGGPAWTLDETTGQYYLHLFLPEQPDLNWRNPAVLEAFDRVLDFWLDRGVDGFRIDVAQALVKDAELRSNPQVGPLEPDADRWAQWFAFDHRHDVLQPEAAAIFARWNRLVSARDAMLLGEVYALEPDLMAPLLGDGRLHAGFWFGPMHMPWDAHEIRATLTAPSALGPAVGWVQSSHDEPRPVTRFGGGSQGRDRALALMTLLLGLPGVPFLYQGEELGLADGEVPEHLKADPVGDGVAGGRDGCRTPMPWAPGPGAGFTTGPSPWLPIGHGDSETVEAQRADPGSHLHRVRALLTLRRRLDGLVGQPLRWWEPHGELVAFDRGPYRFVLNASADPIDIDLEGDERVLFASSSPASPAPSVGGSVAGPADRRRVPARVAADSAVVVGPPFEEDR